ncbi:MAG: hypothetical protein WBD74_01775 [Candidatus Aquilonibacter sp.]
MKTLRFVLETVTETFTVASFASVTVTVQEPVSAPGVTVNVTAAPELAGVAFDGLTCATKGFVGGDCPDGFAVHEIEDVNAAVSFASETVNV